MIRQLLMVSDDGQPDFVVSPSDNFENWIADGNSGVFALVCIIIGIFLGLFIAYIIKSFKSESFTLYCDKCNMDISEKWNYCPGCGDSTKPQKENIESNETTNSNKSDNAKPKKVTIEIVLILAVTIIILVVLLIVGVANANASQNGPAISIFDTINTQHKATKDDIYLTFTLKEHLTKHDEYIVNLQANEKIKDLIIEFDFLDQNGNVLKTETLEVGDVTPGNKYSFTLTQGNVSINNLDKTKRFKYRVTNGYLIEE